MTTLEIKCMSQTSRTALHHFKSLALLHNLIYITPGKNTHMSLMQTLYTVLTAESAIPSPHNCSRSTYLAVCIMH